MALKLKRNLSLFDVTIYGVGIILGAGVYALIGQAAGIAGNAIWLSFLFGAVLAAITGLSYAELSSMYPREAAEYVYTKKAFNSKGLAFVIGWLIIITGTVAAAAVAIGFGGYLEALTGFNPFISAACLIGALSLLNFWGIKQSSRANIVFTVVELSGLLLIIALAFMFGDFSSVNFFESPTGFSGVFAAAALIFFAYIGFEDVVNISEEVKNPRRNVPKALLYSIVITTIVYVLVAISVVALVPWQELANSIAPLATAAEGTFPGAGFVLSVIALFATANTVLIILIVQSRMAYGMAREHSLPTFLSKLHEVRRTPWVAIIITTLIVLGFLAIRNIRTIAEVTNFGVFITFIIVNAALIALRYKAPKANRRFKVPLNIGKFPVLPVCGIIVSVAMLLKLNPVIHYIGLGIIASGVIIYAITKAREHYKK